MTFKLIHRLIHSCSICFLLHIPVNWGSVTTGYKGGFDYKEPAHYEVVVPHKITEDGDFISYMIPHHYKRSYYRNKRSADLTSQDKVHYNVPIAGRDYHLELEPSIGLISPSMVVERFDKNRTLNPSLAPSSDVQCHYRGTIRGDNSSKAAISTCYGLAGYVRSNDNYYFIEPAADYFPLSGEEHPHLIYKRQSEKPDLEKSCYVTSDVAKVIAKRAATVNSRDTQKRKDLHVQQLHIETLVVLDSSMVQYHKSIDLENYILTVFNMAHDLFHDCSLGANINLAIVRLVRLEFEEHELNLKLNGDSNKTLQYFAAWQKKMNPGDDTHPNHHDVAVLLTRTDICGSDRNCAILGAARVGGMCDPADSAALCEDNGLRLGFVIAHEIAHTLAIPHDTQTESGCIDRIAEKFTTVMSTTVGVRTAGWSQCSKKYLKLFMDSGLGNCLYDPPTEHSFEMPDILPGVMYGGDFQCKELFGPNAALCETGTDCENLICYLEDKGCVETHMPISDGTTCGEKKWCYGGECIQTGERPSAVNGGWSAWNSWSVCSRTCGAGVMWQERYCNSPMPSRGGKYCQGEHRRYQICNTLPCDAKQLSFRDVQCAEFDDWVYPEDGKLHSWTSYKMPEENPCVLFCVNDDGAIAALKPRVEDGTPCYRGMRDICINGLCQEIPCDLKVGSNAVEDACGVCHGDGTSCDLHEGKRFFNSSKSEERVLLMQLCKGTVNVKVEEVEPSESRMQVTSANGTEMFVDGFNLGLFNVPGSKAWLGMIRNKQEALEIPGPTTTLLSIWIIPLENITVKYSYGTPTFERHKASYAWEYTDWSKCSAFCGPGTETAIPKCVEKTAGLVDNDYCSQIPPLKQQVRPCEIAPCIPRWMVGDWQSCICSRGKRERVVKCVRPTGEGEGEVDVIPDKECARPKPRVKDKCKCQPSATEVRSLSHKVAKRLMMDIDNSVVPMFVADSEIERNKTVVDKDDITNITLTIHVEIEDGRKYPKGVPRPPGNSSVVILEGKQALAFLNQMQKDFSNNRTKI